MQDKVNCTPWLLDVIWKREFNEGFTTIRTIIEMRSVWEYCFANSLCCGPVTPFFHAWAVCYWPGSSPTSLSRWEVTIFFKHCVFNGSFLGCINSEITKSEFRSRPRMPKGNGLAKLSHVTRNQSVTNPISFKLGHFVTICWCCNFELVRDTFIITTTC